jgi:hypothetical protein
MKSDDPNPFLEMVRLDIGVCHDVVSCAHAHVSPIAPVATWPPAQERRHQGVAPRVGGTCCTARIVPSPPSFPPCRSLPWLGRVPLPRDPRLIDRPRPYAAFVDVV